MDHGEPADYENGWFCHNKVYRSDGTLLWGYYKMTTQSNHTDDPFNILEETSMRIKRGEIFGIVNLQANNPSTVKSLEWMFEEAHIYSGTDGLIELYDIVDGSDQSSKSIILEGLSASAEQLQLDVWDILNTLREQSQKVMIITTSFHEAEQWCDRVALVDEGKIIAVGSPYDLIQQAQPETEICFPASDEFDSQMLYNIPHVTRIEEHNGLVHVFGQAAMRPILILALQNAGIKASAMGTVQVTLEDVCRSFNVN